MIEQQKIARYYISNVNTAEQELEIFYRIITTEGEEKTKRLDVSNEGTNYSMSKKPAKVDYSALNKMPIVKDLKKNKTIWAKSNTKGHIVTDPKAVAGVIREEGTVEVQAVAIA